MYVKNILSNQVRNVTIRISKNCFMGCCFQCHVSSIWKTCTRKKSGLNAFQAKGEEALFIQDKNEKRSDSFAGFLFLFFLFFYFGYSAQKLLVLLNICVAHRNALLELE